MKLNLAVALKIISPRLQERLMELNTLRNKCSHNWLLKRPVRYGKRPHQLKPPLLLYRQQDLHKVDGIQAFIAEYGTIYYRLFMKYLD
jgi:hypothetical protein